MNFDESNMLSQEYLSHKIFEQISALSSFYDSLAESTSLWIDQGTKAITNLDSYTFRSIKGTLESIQDILFKGRINDSYALLRKYYDSTIINVYTNIFIQDNISSENFVVEHIDNWRQGKETIPEYRVISEYIKKSTKLQSLTELLSKDDLYKKIRDRCNSHTHYNKYYNFLLNDNQIYLPIRDKILDMFLRDLLALFIQHFSLLFYVNDHYMMSSDFRDSVDLGLSPEEGSEYWVAPFIQKAFDKWIKPNRPDIAAAIKQNTSMNLD